MNLKIKKGVTNNSFVSTIMFVFMHFALICKTFFVIVNYILKFDTIQVLFCTTKTLLVDIFVKLMCIK